MSKEKIEKYSRTLEHKVPTRTEELARSVDELTALGEIIKDGLGDMVELNGVSLGITANANYDKKEITLSPEESILLYSDGLIEAENEKQELFGNERLIRYAKHKIDRHIGGGIVG